jgi:hypothetical protein
MTHAQKQDFVLQHLKCNGTCAETRFRLTAFEMRWHMRRNQISSYSVWNVMAHAQKPDFVLLRLTCDGTCAETRFRLAAFEMWWHLRRKQIKSYCVWNVMVHAQKPYFVFRAKRTSPFKSAGGRQFSRLLAVEVCASAVVMLDTPCSEGSVKSTGYPLHFPITSPPVGHRVPSHINWTLLSEAWRSTKRISRTEAMSWHNISKRLQHLICQ